MLKFTFTKGHDKDTDEQPDEEKCWVRSGEVQSTGASALMQLGGLHLPGVDVFANLETLNPILWGFDLDFPM